MPQWAQDQERYDALMGEVPAGASVLDMAGVLLGLTFRIGLLLAFCALVYLVGRAVVG